MHILKQLQQGAKLDSEEYVKGTHGYEPVIVLDVKGQKVFKRIFHPRDYKGADFAVSKIRKDGSFGFSVVQVKRNHGNQQFTLIENKYTHEITQLVEFSKWSSGCYLLIDETTNPPTDCFVTSQELIAIIEFNTGRNFPFNSMPKIDIPNADVRKYYRGTRIFYEAFYTCWRGATLKPGAFVDAALEYVDKTDRALVELFVKGEL